MTDSQPAPAKRSRRIVETEEYAAFLGRAIDALVERCAADPAGLIHFPELIKRMQDGYNWAVARAKDGQDSYTLTEIASVLGVSGPAIQQRVNKGRALIATAEDAAGVTRLRDSLGRPSVPAYRAERAAAFEAAGIEDKRQGRHRKTA